GPDEAQDLIGAGRDAAMVFQGYVNAELPRMSAHFLNGFQATGSGPFLGVSLVDVAGKNADGLATQPGGMFDPAFDVGDLVFVAGPVGGAEVVANRGAADVQSQAGAASLE